MMQSLPMTLKLRWLELRAVGFASALLPGVLTSDTPTVLMCDGSLMDWRLDWPVGGGAVFECGFGLWGEPCFFVSCDEGLSR